VQPYPSYVERLNTIFATEGIWADSHHEEVTTEYAAATGVELAAIRRYVDRSTFRVVPVDDEVTATQQAVADRFTRLGLIPKAIRVSEIVWRWTPAS
jgi:sulfonate transport system substrate-binding protein